MGRTSESGGGDGPRTTGLEELGALVLRVWREPAPGGGLRLRIFASEGPSDPVEATTAASVEAAIEVVRDWLSRREAGAR
ncbi:hypothetical protein SA2016_0999 [Sinomonas atrocyanea]|uniref:Uncharacterized protein n=1 Tax=Sinomonas atrocyanea TaxID=37927 RepID=A0A126ZYP3_9MICC|nr:hypothetical protein SA2016_0999 [Sinomonas atrocyanea]GEB65328.1 hypothetical protein SAT01_27760 [Sinomonas atrocyanea]GGG59203.1 hypothetical protein GCM10007172_07590 [Sinomonas atrocyanea]